MECIMEMDHGSIICVFPSLSDQIQSKSGSLFLKIVIRIRSILFPLLGKTIWIDSHGSLNTGGTWDFFVKSQSDIKN
jgi:hypothetical protein